MINIYLNYPNSIATLHQTRDCPRIQQHHSANQRIVKINAETLQRELSRFINGEIIFRSEASYNDMWMEIDFNDLEFEIETAKFILRLLGKRYNAFDSLTPDIHC